MPSPIKTIALALSLAGAFATAASAKCSRLGFSVNDYGKDGPTKDAKDLLDKYIAKWAADRSIKKYTTGKKDVKCALFLDFGVFDEHTCRAEATVCWGEPGVTTAAAPKAGGGTAAPIETGSVVKPAAPAAPPAASAAEPVPAAPAAEPEKK